MLRLGDTVSRTGSISPDALERVISTVRRFASLAEANGATEIVARATAALHLRTCGLGLSLADRACLVLSQRLGLRVLTTDRAWRRLARVKVELIR